MVIDPRRDPINEASDMVWTDVCVPPPTDLATILILNTTTVDFDTNTRMVFASNEVNGGASPYTYTWDRSDGNGAVNGPRDLVFTFDCALLPTTIVGVATDANSDQVTDSLAVPACGTPPAPVPVDVVEPTPPVVTSTPRPQAVAPATANVALPATDAIDTVEGPMPAPIVPIGIFIVVVVGLVARPSRQTRTARR